MNLQHQTVRAGCDASPRHGWHEFAATGGGAGINNNGQVSELMEKGDTRKVEHVARLGIETAHASFT